MKLIGFVVNCSNIEKIVVFVMKTRKFLNSVSFRQFLSNVMHLNEFLCILLSLGMESFGANAITSPSRCSDSALVSLHFPS